MARASCERIIEVSGWEGSLKMEGNPSMRCKMGKFISEDKGNCFLSLSVAVAIYSVMILDEATFLIDIRTEVLVHKEWII